MYSSIVQAVQAHAQRTPNHLAVADVERDYTYEELAVAASQAVKVLQEIGIKEKDAVLVECTQKATFLILDLACEQIGAVFIPLERKMTEARVCSIYEETEAKCVIAETVYEVAHFCSLTDLLEKMEMQPHTWEAYEEKNPVAEILFTTGTTGQPKGIVISHQANIAIAENIQYGTQMTGQTVELVPMPLSHSHGLRTCYANLLNGSAVVLLDGVMNIALFFEMIEKFGVNALDLSPTLAKLLLKIARRGLVKYSQVIDYIEIGTAFLDDELKGKLKEIFPSSRLYNFYGSTEAGRSCVLDFNQMDFTGCIGYPSKNAAFLIVDDEHHVMQSSKENPGLLAVRGPMMMDGYLGNEELTRTVLMTYCIPMIWAISMRKVGYTCWVDRMMSLTIRELRLRPKRLRPWRCSMQELRIARAFLCRIRCAARCQSCMWLLLQIIVSRNCLWYCATVWRRRGFRYSSRQQI